MATEEGDELPAVLAPERGGISTTVRGKHRADDRTLDVNDLVENAERESTYSITRCSSELRDLRAREQRRLSERSCEARWSALRRLTAAHTRGPVASLTNSVR